MSTQTEPEHHGVLITTHYTGRDGRPTSKFLVRCRCGYKTQETSSSSLCWQSFDMHREQSEVGTSEPAPGVTN